MTNAPITDEELTRWESIHDGLDILPNSIGLIFGPANSKRLIEEVRRLRSYHRQAHAVIREIASIDIPEGTPEYAWLCGQYVSAKAVRQARAVLNGVGA